MGRPATRQAALDTELTGLPPELRWREWMGRVEAIIFAAPAPVTRETLARVVGRDCNIDLVIADIRAELRGRPYELAAVAGGWQLRTKKTFADTIHAVSGQGPERGRGARELSRADSLVLMAIAYFQPIARGELSQFFGHEVSRDRIAALRAQGFIAPGPRSPTPGAPYAFVTTKTFLTQFGFATLRDLPDIEMLEDAGLISKDRLLAGELPGGFATRDDEDEDGDRPDARPPQFDRADD